jgi:eukaryotic-like serine/threonine-protein kinase
MAPEQIQNGEVDARSDIFSFGVVLYEMITGRLPFHGDHEAGIMYSILTEEPVPAELHRSGLPSELLHVLHRSLEKNPEERYQNVADMVIDLRRVKRQSTRVSRSGVVILPAGAPADRKTGPGRAVPPEGRRWVIIVPAALIVVAAAAWLVLRIAGPSALTGKISPNMSFRVVPIPFTQINYPGLSQDGNWIAFPASDANHRWELYFMNSGTGGEARQITRDSSVGMNQADISPDGGRITYDRANRISGSVEVAVISSLGGVSKVVAPVGIIPRWNPAGDRIGFIRGIGLFVPSDSHRLEFWSVRADGSGARREFIDSISANGRFSFSWSPDGKSVAWIISSPDGTQEVVVRNLATSSIRQLTFDRKNIDEVCWTHQGEIIYSSNKSGNMNLWMIPAAGGDAVQITRGSGPDFGMKISADGTRLLYYQQRTVSNLWIAGLDGSNPRQLTSEDRRLTSPALSPDGRMILFEVWGADFAKLERSVAVMNLDGSARHEVTSGDGICTQPMWSPDGNWISFLTRHAGEPSDSSRLEMLDAANPAVPRVVARGVGYGWLDARTLAIGRPLGGKFRTSIIGVDGTVISVFSEDSTGIIPFLHQKYGLSFWAQPERPEIRLVPMPGGAPDWVHAVVVNSVPWANLDRAPDETYALILNNPDRLVKILIPSGKREPLNHKFPGLSVSSEFHLSRDGRQIVYNDSRINGSLVLIENLR